MYIYTFNGSIQIIFITLFAVYLVLRLHELINISQQSWKYNFDFTNDKWWGDSENI